MTDLLGHRQRRDAYASSLLRDAIGEGGGGARRPSPALEESRGATGLAQGEAVAALALLEAAGLARRALRRRADRVRRFGPELGQDGVWNMLLELVIARAEGRTIATKCLWLASGAPQSSALRWVNLLVAAGHLVRSTDPTDARRQILTINDDLAAQVAGFLRLTEAE